MLKDDDATTGYDLLMAAENDEELAELSRLLYVATTRAADYLILSAGVEEPGKATGPWMELLATTVRSDDGSNESDGERARASRRPATPNPIRLVTVTTDRAGDPIEAGRSSAAARFDEDRREGRADGRRRPGQAAAILGAGALRRRRARRQYSFSRLTGKLHAQTAAIDASPLEGDASAEPPLDARGLGTLVHAVLEEIDFARPGDVAERVRRLAEQHLSGDERQREQTLAVEMIERFCRSPRAAQLAAAKEMFRELEFLLAWPPGGNDAAPDGRYLQGFIDCLYRDADGGWRLIDYKTNRATAETLAATAAPYEMQMLVYALAAETILKCPPAELTLCFLRPGLEYHFAWDAAARQRAVELVERALP